MQSEQSSGGTYRFYSLRMALAKAIGMAICEPKLRLGRRRPDGHCGRGGWLIETYAAEKLDFPLDNLAPNTSTSFEKLQAMWNAEYVRVCLECSNEKGTDNTGGENDGD